MIAGLATGALGVLLGLAELGSNFERHVGLKWLFNVRGPIEAPKEVAIVAIDARTGGQLGLSDLPRE